MDVKHHWDQVYTTKSDAEVSWTQPEPTTSLSLITSTTPAGGRVIDVGGGASLLTRTVPSGGHAIIATFAPDGPEKCSGLPVQRYDAPSLAAALGPSLELLRTLPETHLTPWGKPQSFQYSLFRRV